MAKYTVTRACGHEEPVALIGKAKDREWRLEKVEPYKLCYECYQEDMKRRREEANREAAEVAKENRYPALTGTEKQIPWAETVRIELMARMEEIIHNKRYGVENASLFQNAVEHIKETKTTAHWWIDHRFLTGDSTGIIALLNDTIKLIKHEALMPPKEEIKQALAESTVRPEKSLTETVAEIRVKENTIEIFFPEKREDFREIVKNGLRMKCDGKWKRNLVSRNGIPEDRAAEAGHRLLAAGFIIRIFDEGIREKTVAGDYEPECTSWILAKVKGDYEGWLVINWSREDDFYKAARRLPGSRYSRPSVVVPPEHYEEVLDFAEMYGFKVSGAAQRLIDNARMIKQNTLIANVEPPVEKEHALGLSTPPVLDVPENVEVADEFKD